MRAEGVVALMRRLRSEGVVAWLDGGWAVDALLGRQTREHSDVDLVLDRDAVGRVRSMLEADGYVLLRDELPASVAYGHPETGDEVDLHPLRLTRDGGGDQQYGDGRPPWHYGAPVPGVVGGEVVPCCDLDTQLRAHVGYDPRPVDHADMAALRERFGCDLPDPYG
jgi:lincosamide nucleotidyltransferase A/C/D/E